MAFNKKEYDKKYVKENLKRISLNLQKDNYKILKEVSDKYGYSVSAFIKEAIQEKIEKLH